MHVRDYCDNVSAELMGWKVKMYDVMRKLGPNDGMTLLADQLVPGGIVITDVGLDHYYLDPEIDLKTFALCSVVINQMRFIAP